MLKTILFHNFSPPSTPKAVSTPRSTRIANTPKTPRTPKAVGMYVYNIFWNQLNRHETPIYSETFSALLKIGHRSEHEVCIVPVT